MRHIFNLVVLLSLAVTFSSCERADIDVFKIEGYITDDVSNVGVEGIQIYIDAVKSSSGMGIITDGRRKSAGSATTDKNGYYKAKLKIFEGAERLELFINGNNEREGYVSRTTDLSLSDLKKASVNTVNYTLSPTAILKVKFKNTSPASDTDKFWFNWFNSGIGLPRGYLNRESCGTVKENESFQWIGKDVCGIYTIEAVAGRKAMLYWTVVKNGETIRYKDSVFVARAVQNEFSINY